MLFSLLRFFFFDSFGLLVILDCASIAIVSECESQKMKEIVCAWWWCTDALIGDAMWSDLMCDEVTNLQVSDESSRKKVNRNISFIAHSAAFLRSFFSDINQMHLNSIETDTRDGDSDAATWYYRLDRLTNYDRGWDFSRSFEKLFLPIFLCAIDISAHLKTKSIQNSNNQKLRRISFASRLSTKYF